MLEAEGKNHSAKIGHQIGKSATTLPNVAFIREGETPVAYLDYPGEFDTKGLLQEIGNTAIKAHLANQAQRIKITLVVPKSSLTDSRGILFVQTLQAIERLIGGWKPFEKPGAVALVVTNAERKKKAPQQLLTLLQALIKNTPQLDAAKVMLQTIIDRQALALFCKPQKERIPNPEDSEESEEEIIPVGKPYKPRKAHTHKQILAVLGALSFLEKEEKTPLFTRHLGPQAQAIVHQIGCQLVKKIEKKILHEAKIECNESTTKALRLGKPWREPLEKAKAQLQQQQILSALCTLLISKESPDLTSLKQSHAFFSTLDPPPPPPTVRLGLLNNTV